jgi:tripartite-type tricarboxylate transporter receptor subunit TctC
MKSKAALCHCVVLFVMAASVLWVRPAGAQQYPKGTVQIVVPFSPGGSTDIFWRTLSDTLSKHLGANLAVLNKPGGGGVVGVSSVVTAKSDGYTLAAGNSDTLNITPLFTSEIPFDPVNSLTYLFKMAFFPQCIAVRADSPFKTLEDLAAFARANPKKLKAGTSGVGTSPYMAVHMFNDDAGVEITPVAFGGGGEVVPNLLGGHVDFAFVAVPPVKPQVVAGKARILAILSLKRHPLHPDIPTAVEKGFKKTVVETGLGLVGPRGLPAPVVRKWEKVAQETLKDPTVIAGIQKLDYVVDYMNGESYKKDVAREFEYFKKLMANVGGKK